MHVSSSRPFQSSHGLASPLLLRRRDRRLGPLGPLWQYLVGTGNKNWQRARQFTFLDVAEFAKGWEWGAREAPFIKFASCVIELLDGPSSEPVDEEIVQAILHLSDVSRKVIMGKGDAQYWNNWSGLLRWYDDDMEYHSDKSWKDILARRCDNCGNWRVLREDWTACTSCGVVQGEGRRKIVRVHSVSS
jgi:hypothetical protein